MSTQKAAADAPTPETPTTAEIETAAGTRLTLREDPDTVEEPLALGLKLDTACGEPQVGVTGLYPDAVVEHGELVDLLDALDLAAETDASGRAGTLYYDPDAGTVAYDLD